MELPGEKLAIKLLDVLSGTVSTVARPWLDKRAARARAILEADTKSIARLAQEKLRQEIKDVRSGNALITADYKVKSSAPNEERLQAQIKADYVAALEASSIPRPRLIELERQINLDQIASIAMNEAGEDATGVADDEPLDPDWFVQWRNRAQDVSSEQMQRLWGRVLKGQAKTSGSFSIHTMDFLSRMSKSDAELVAKVGNVAIDGQAIFKGDKKNLEDIGLTFERLLYLEDLGILGGVSSGAVGLSIKKELGSLFNGSLAVIFRCNSQVLILYEPKNPDLRNVEMPAYAISTTGRELLKLATCSPPPGYLNAVGKSLIDKFNHAALGELGVPQPNGLIQIVNPSPL